MRPIESILDDWHDWPVVSRPTLLKSFTEGLNHETALLSVGRDQFVLKRFLGASGRQIESQLWAASLGVAPEVLFAPPNHEYMLMEALFGDSLRAEQTDTATLQALANSLNVMHQAKPGPKSLEGFDIREFCGQYLNESDDKATRLHKELLPILGLFQNDSTPWVFCHNDLVTENCFVEANAAQFIDWEYADFHNPWFDLAAIVYYFNLTDDQARTLLSNYQTGMDLKVGEPIFYASQIALLWGDMLWHLDKFGIDYWSKLNAKERRLERLTNKLVL